MEKFEFLTIFTCQKYLKFLKYERSTQNKKELALKRFTSNRPFIFNHHQPIKLSDRWGMF